MQDHIYNLYRIVLDAIPFSIRDSLIWQEDGTPLHNAIVVHNYLNEN